MIRAYEAGKSAAGRDLAEWVWSGAGDSLDLSDPIESAFFEAGRLGREMPSWARGWQYGHVPATGVSYNFRDQRPEAGVSMMHVDGCAYEPDGTYEIFNGTSVRVKCEGWLVTHKSGTDGEPLLVGAVEIKVEQ